MSNREGHEPECHDTYDLAGVCICEELRQAYERGRREVITTTVAYVYGQRDALAAAVQRVEALFPRTQITFSQQVKVIAAIKGDSDE